MSNILSLNKVSRNYLVRETLINVFSEIDIDIKKGEKVAIIGPSGSGKTSILNIAGLIERPNSGSVYVNNSEVDWKSDKKISNLRKKNIGYVFQFNNLLSDFTILENIAFPLIINGMQKNQAIEMASDFIKNVNLSNRGNNYPSQVSGGEQQRAAIARALINKPSLIIADEPTGNLDSENSELISKILFDYVSDEKASLIMVTHDNNLASRTMKKIKIKDGRID